MGCDESKWTPYSQNFQSFTQILELPVSQNYEMTAYGKDKCYFCST